MFQRYLVQCWICRTPKGINFSGLCKACFVAHPGIAAVRISGEIEERCVPLDDAGMLGAISIMHQFSDKRFADDVGWYNPHDLTPRR